VLFPAAVVGAVAVALSKSALTPPEADWLLRLPGGNLTGAIAASTSRVSRLQAVYPRLRYTELDACERAHNAELGMAAKSSRGSWRRSASGSRRATGVTGVASKVQLREA
jgi:hypothetical protein